jgi:hypothetical protein
MEAFGQRGVPQASLWGQCPHYVQVAQNPAVSHALLTGLQPFLPSRLNLSRVAREAEQFNSTLGRALEEQKEIADYVKRLEQAYDAEQLSRPAQGTPEAGDVVKDLEDFLRQQRRQSPDEGGENKN